MGLVESISSGGTVLAYLIRAAWAPEQTAFASSEEDDFQLGCFVYPAGAEVPGHSHSAAVHEVHGSSEFLLVRKGRCEVDLYDERRQLFRTVELGMGDALLMLAGGHGLRILEETVLLSVKQGPYPGPAGKERF